MVATGGGVTAATAAAVVTESVLEIPSNARRLPISDSIIAGEVIVDSSLPVGALAARLANFNVQAREMTNMSRNNWSLWLSCKAYLLAVASDSDKTIWQNHERAATVRAGGVLTTTEDFHSTALLLEGRLRERLHAAETRLSIVRKKDTTLTLNSLEGRRSALNKKDPTIDAHLKSKPIGCELDSLNLIPFTAATSAAMSDSAEQPSNKRAADKERSKVDKAAKRRLRQRTQEKLIKAQGISHPVSTVVAAPSFCEAVETVALPSGVVSASDADAAMASPSSSSSSSSSSYFPDAAAASAELSRGSASWGFLKRK
jgi:hypothetical protein